VIASPDTVGDLGAYTRVAGTHYLIASGVVTPALPASCIRLMDVTTAAGAISGVVDVRQSSALIARFLTPYVRLIGQEIGGVDYIIQENLGNLLISINTRTEDHPLHTPRFTLVPTASNLTLVSTATVPRTQTFPDKAGTFAMLSDITASAFAPGTRMLFDNDTAPTGWTRVVSIDDEVVRIVSGARADGGSWTVSGLTAAGHAITVAEMPSHVHAGESGNAFGMLGGGGTATGGTLIGAAGQTAAAGGDQQHTHNVVSDGTWRPLHRDVILCSKT